MSQLTMFEIFGGLDGTASPKKPEIASESIISQVDVGLHSIPTNVVHHGDNLAVLSNLPTNSIDLIYIDPPFNSGRVHAARGKKGEMRSFDDRFESKAAYIAFMRSRCIEIQRILKPTGSFYLHCDDSASSELAIMLDEVFGWDNLIDKIVWKRTSSHGNCKSFGRVHDTILFYAKSSNYYFNPPDGLTNFWDDIPPLNSQVRERIGYPTQKPEALLARIISASSQPGNVVLDAFCGSGTTLAVADKLGRRWIGIDASGDACAVARQRLTI